eukprot:g78831.t1
MSMHRPRFLYCCYYFLYCLIPGYSGPRFPYCRYKFLRRLIPGFSETFNHIHILILHNPPRLFELLLYQYIIVGRPGAEAAKLQVPMVGKNLISHRPLKEAKPAQAVTCAPQDNKRKIRRTCLNCKQYDSILTLRV